MHLDLSSLLVFHQLCFFAIRFLSTNSWTNLKSAIIIYLCFFFCHLWISQESQCIVEQLENQQHDIMLWRNTRIRKYSRNWQIHMQRNLRRKRCLLSSIPGFWQWYCRARTQRDNGFDTHCSNSMHSALNTRHRPLCNHSLPNTWGPCTTADKRSRILAVTNKVPFLFALVFITSVTSWFLMACD